MKQSLSNNSTGLLWTLTTFFPRADADGDAITLDAFRGFREPEEEAPEDWVATFDWPERGLHPN